MNMQLISMGIDRLLEGYRSESFTISDVLQQVLTRIDSDSANPIWISLVSSKDLNERARQLEDMETDELPLYGIPFAVKDNIDAIPLPTTAACPDFSYIPTKNAPVIEKLIGAGAILIGKTNIYIV